MSAPAIISPAARGIFAWKNTGDFSDIVGFEIRGLDCHGIGLAGSFQRAVSNNVHNAAVGCNANPGSGSGIDALDYSSRDDEIISNFVHDVGLQDPECGQRDHDRVHGIYQANAGGRIHGNISANNCGFGIHLWHGASHARIVNNTVVLNRGGGILIGSGDAPCSSKGCPGGDDFTVAGNNIIAFNGAPSVKAWGILEYAQSPGVIGAHNEYFTNLSYGNSGGDFNLDNHLVCVGCIRGQDPLFAAFASFDFRLRAGSPALGHATAQDEASFSAFPLRNAYRATDIGAGMPVDASNAR